MRTLKEIRDAANAAFMANELMQDQADDITDLLDEVVRLHRELAYQTNLAQFSRSADLAALAKADNQ